MLKSAIEPLALALFSICKNFMLFLKVKGNNSQHSGSLDSKKEVFQPHLPIRLPCYDLAPVTDFTLSGSLRLPISGTPGFHGLTGGVYKVRERIHRSIADLRLLAIPASRSRVADCDPNCGCVFEISFMSPCRCPLSHPL